MSPFLIPFMSSQGDEDGIYQAVGSVGPVSICYDVTMGFQLYKKGVYSRYSPIPIPVWIDPNDPNCMYLASQAGYVGGGKVHFPPLCGLGTRLVMLEHRMTPFLLKITSSCVMDQTRLLCRHGIIKMCARL